MYKHRIIFYITATKILKVTNIAYSTYIVAIVKAIKVYTLSILIYKTD